MINSQHKNQRSVSYAHRENRQLTILSKFLSDNPRQEIQWKRTSKIKTSPSATFGKSERNSQEKYLAPGPGTYELNRTTFQKGFVTFKGNKRLRFHTDTPGPGAYQANVAFPSKKFSFQKSVPHPKIEQKPSPATYELRESKINGLSFPKEERNLTPEKQKMIIPGPGQYESNRGVSHKNQFSFTKTKKFFASQQESEEKDSTPGPAAYEISKSRNIIKSTKFAKAIRTFLEDDKIPGPGSYHYEKSSLLQQGGIIPIERRSFDYESQVPGPGNYKEVPVSSIKRKDAVVIIGRSRGSSNQQKNHIPGPGAYFSEKKSAQKILGGVIGRQSRSNQKKVLVPNLQHTAHIISSKQSQQDNLPLSGFQRRSSQEINVRKSHSFLINKIKLSSTDHPVHENLQTAIAQ